MAEMINTTKVQMQTAPKQNDFPTETIELPSQGLVYPEGHPLRKGTIEIKYMTAREEDILASQNLIKKGIVLDKLFESVVVEPGVNPNDIYIGDKIEQWKLKGAFISQANFGDLAFDSNEPATIELTLSYDYAILEF